MPEPLTGPDLPPEPWSKETTEEPSPDSAHWIRDAQGPWRPTALGLRRIRRCRRPRPAPCRRDCWAPTVPGGAATHASPRQDRELPTAHAQDHDERRTAGSWTAGDSWSTSADAVR